MRTTYVLDTSALIYDPLTFRRFPHSDIIIPIAVLNELDNLKKLPNEAGKNARVCIRLLDEITNAGDISTGVLLDDDIMLKIDTSYIDLSQDQYKSFGSPTYGDTQILACAYDNWLAHVANDVILVSNDINLRVKAKSRNIDAISHEDGSHSINDIYSGVQTIVDEEIGLELQQNSVIDPKFFNLDLMPHECVIFENSEGVPLSMGRKVSENKVQVIRKIYPWSIAARNREQSFAIDLIMDPNVDLITLIGKAGTGKSLIVLATALELVLNQKKYDKFVIYRPIQSVGNEIGFLPGTKEEKLAPWFQAIMDNFEMLFTSKNGGDWRKEVEMYQRKGKIEMEAITYIRGRSIPNAIILIDEAQNLSREEVKTILTRAGENTKIILTGDIEQIDNSGLDATSNGLTYAIEKFKNSELAGHITLTQGERSKLASLAAEIL